jgi:hypothetical protein
LKNKGEKSIAFKKPHLIKEWDYVKNNGLEPQQISYGSVKKVWWLCPKGHSYESKPNHRYHGAGCSYCSGKKVLPENSLQSLFPSIAEEFHPELNVKNSSEYAGMSNKKVWWRGKCGHEWEAPVADRTHKKNGCPYCTGVRICKDNSLGSLYPKVALEWNTIRNGETSPFDYTSKSEKKVWWLCSKCLFEWKAAISNRTGLNSGCPQCNESKGEKRIREWLIEHSITFETQKEFNGLVGINSGLLSYDFYLPEKNLLIEFQGQFHDGNGNDYVKRKFDKQQEHDRRKKEFALLNNIELMEIWYWDFNKIEDILKSEISE